MSADAPPPARAGNGLLAAAAAAATVLRHTRERRPGELNLKSCELLHPLIALFHAETMRTASPWDVVAYPIYEDTYAQVARHLGVPVEELVLCPGSEPAIALLVRAFAPIRIVAHAPLFEAWERYAQLYGCAVHPVPPREDGGRLDVADLITALRGGPPSLVVLTQPHGHTGQVFGAGEVTALAEAVSAHDSLLIVDTCYLAFVAGGEATVQATTGLPHVVRVNSFSKAFGLAGARIAAVATHPDTADYLLRFNPESALSGIALTLLRAALRRPEVFASIWTDVRRLRDLLASKVERALPGWLARPGGANFVTFDVPSRAQADLVYVGLLGRGIRTRNLSGLPGLPAAVRISVPSEHAVRCVVDALDGLPGGQDARQGSGGL